MKDLALMAECGYAAHENKVAEFNVDEISIKVNGLNVVSASPAERVFYEGSNYEFVITVNNICHNHPEIDNYLELMSDEDKTIRVKVFREGCVGAIYEYSYLPQYDDDYMIACAHETVGCMKPGRYFVRIENVAMTTVAINSNASAADDCQTFVATDIYGITFGFSILPNGMYMEHQMPRRVSATLAGSADRELKFCVQLQSPASSQDVYDVCCISPSLMPVGSCRVDVDRHGHGKAELGWNHYWADGTYRCVLVHNGEPFAMAGVEIAGEKVVGCTTAEAVDASMSEYLFASPGLLTEDMKKLLSIEGCENIKRLGLDVYRANSHNRYREKAGIKDLNMAGHFCFYSSGSQRELEVIKDFAYAAFPLKSLETIDLADCMSPYLTTDPVDEIREKLENGRRIILVKNAGSLLWGNGKRISNVIEQRMRDSDGPTMVFYGNRAEIERLSDTLPQLFSLISSKNRVGFGTLDCGGAVHAVENSLKRRELALSVNARKSIAGGLAQRMAQGSLMNLGVDFGDMFVGKALLPRFTRRLYADVCGKRCDDKIFLTTVKSADIDWSGIDGMVAPIDECLGEIDGMVGLSSVKETIKTMALKARFENARRRQGLPVRSAASHHMIFTGNPGTGKTTIAKKLGKIFHSLGILSKGEVVVAERSTMVGRFIGQTEQNMQMLLEQAQGNVLFIDEAYTLCDTVDDRKDFGYRALECLLTVLAQKSPDMVVVMAGYEKEMNRMLDTNQGLRGRFPYRLNFDDYSVDELMEIGTRYIAANGLSITAEATSRLRSMVVEQTAAKKRDFSNARWMELLIDNSVVPAMSERVFKETTATSASLTEITVADIEKVAGKLPKAKLERKIGF